MLTTSNPKVTAASLFFFNGKRKKRLYNYYSFFFFKTVLPFLLFRVGKKFQSYTLWEENLIKMSILGIVSLVPKASLLMIQPTESQDHDISFTWKKNRIRPEGWSTSFRVRQTFAVRRKMVAIFLLFIYFNVNNKSLSLYNMLLW